MILPSKRNAFKLCCLLVHSETYQEAHQQRLINDFSLHNPRKHQLTVFLVIFDVCRNAGSRWALEQAKYNLVNEYLLVGVTEDLEDFIMILEAALPRFFKGATALYRTGTKICHSSIHRQWDLSAFLMSAVWTLIQWFCFSHHSVVAPF